MKYVISFDEDVELLAFVEEDEEHSEGEEYAEDHSEEEVPNPVLPEVNHMCGPLARSCCCGL